MHENRTFVIAFSPDLRGLLEDNGINITAALRDAGVQVHRTAQPVAISEEEGGKEVVLTLLAVGLTAWMLAAAITKILDAVGRNKKILVTERELRPVLDGANIVVRGADGEPLMYWAEEHRLLEAQQAAQDKSKISAEIRPTMLKFSVSSGG
jgi:hypothetical protein